MGAALRLPRAVFSGRLTTNFMCRSSTRDLKVYTILLALFLKVWRVPLGGGPQGIALMCIGSVRPWKCLLDLNTTLIPQIRHFTFYSFMFIKESFISLEKQFHYWFIHIVIWLIRYIFSGLPSNLIWHMIHWVWVTSLYYISWNQYLSLEKAIQIFKLDST